MCIAILYGKNDKEWSIRNKINSSIFNLLNKYISFKLVISGAFIITLFATEEEFPFPYRDIILKISLIGSWLLNIINITLAYSYIYKSVRSTIATTFIALLS
jgi:PAT family acetyl-CoA transporter-like MFS transporter 1